MDIHGHCIGHDDSLGHYIGTTGNESHYFTKGRYTEQYEDDKENIGWEPRGKMVMRNIHFCQRISAITGVMRCLGNYPKVLLSLFQEAGKFRDGVTARMTEWFLDDVSEYTGPNFHMSRGLLEPRLLVDSNNVVDRIDKATTFTIPANGKRYRRLKRRL